MLDVAVKMDMIENNPFVKVELPKERRVFDKPKQFMEASEFALILKKWTIFIQSVK